MTEHPAMARRLRGLGTTIFAEMSALATRTGAVNLGQGFPDTDGPPVMLAAAAAALGSGRHNQYPPGPGIAPLREAISAHQRRWYGLEYDPETEVLVTTGATEAIAAAVLALVEPGDEVVALEPYYDSYAAVIAMAGGVRVPVTLPAPQQAQQPYQARGAGEQNRSGFRLDLAALRAAVTSRTKLLLINSPHNPTGTVLTREELAGIAALATERDLLVVTDEVYEHMTYDGMPHIPLATFPGMAERTLTISSAGKTFAVTGWKVGWACGPAGLVAAVRTAKQFLTYVSGAPLQPAVAVALGLDDGYYQRLREDLQAKRDLLCEGLAELGLTVFVPQGTYFVTTDVRSLGWEDGTAFCRMLPERCGVVAIPHEVFYDHREAGRPLVRWAFCKRDEVLKEALDRLRRIPAPIKE